MNKSIKDGLTLTGVLALIVAGYCGLRQVSGPSRSFTFKPGISVKGERPKPKYEGKVEPISTDNEKNGLEKIAGGDDDSNFEVIVNSKIHYKKTPYPGDDLRKPYGIENEENINYHTINGEDYIVYAFKVRNEVEETVMDEDGSVVDEATIEHPMIWVCKPNLQKRPRGHSTVAAGGIKKGRKLKFGEGLELRIKNVSKDPNDEYRGTVNYEIVKEKK